MFGGVADKIPFGAAFNKALTLKMGQTHVHRYMRPLLDLIERGRLDATFIISHRLPLSDARRGYEIFRNKDDDCTKVVLQPGLLRIGVSAPARPRPLLRAADRPGRAPRADGLGPPSGSGPAGPRGPPAGRLRRRDRL